MLNEEHPSNETSFRPIVGIDLGTTNSAVAYIRNGIPELIEHHNGERLIPSVVHIDLEGNVIAGEDARSALVAMPERTKAAIKREMGNDHTVRIAGKEYYPEEVAAFILNEIKTLVDDALGEGEKEAVITVPAYFTDEQRKATKRAGELAGFVVERIINEPTAAALAFGYEKSEENRHLLVYDLGGGTFDVSIVEVMDGIIGVKASSGNSKLGGEDFDWLLVDWLSDEMMQQHQVDPRKDMRALALLKEEAEKTKIALSTNNQVEINLPVVMMKDAQPLGLKKTITNDMFIDMIEPLLKETVEKVKEVLQEAKTKPEDMDDILLVGGSTRIPHVQTLLADLFGKNPRHDIHPDEAVTMGAAVQAGIKSGALAESGLIVTDVAPFSMGIAVVEGEPGHPSFRSGLYEAIITKNTTIPVTRSKSYFTTVDGQTMVQIQVYQGEEKLVKDNLYINEFMFEGLPLGSAGAESIEVKFRYNLNGILEVTAKSVSTGEEMTVMMEDAIDRTSETAFEDSVEKIETASEHNPDVLEEWEQGSIFDLLEEDELDVKAMIEEANEWTKRCRTELKNASKEERKQLRNAIKNLEDAVHTNDGEEIEDTIEDVTDMFIDLEL